MATKLIGVVITSSSFLIPAAKDDACRADVPLLKTTAYLAPVYSAKAFSNSFTFCPWVIQSPFKTSPTHVRSFTFASNLSSSDYISILLFLLFLPLNLPWAPILKAFLPYCNHKQVFLSRFEDEYEKDV